MFSAPIPEGASQKNKLINPNALFAQAHKYSNAASAPLGIFKEKRVKKLGGKTYKNNPPTYA